MSMEKTIKELTAKAEEFVREKGFNGLANHTLVKNWMAEFAVEHARDAVQALRNESDMYFEQLKGERAKVAELEAENKRLRDGIEKEVRILRMLPLQNRTECLADLLLPNGNDPTK